MWRGAVEELTIRSREQQQQQQQCPPAGNIISDVNLLGALDV